MGVYKHSMFSNIPMNQNQISDEFTLEYEKSFTVQFIWTGNVTGIVKIQLSNDDGVFTDVPDSAQSTAGASGDHTIDYADCGSKKVRAVFLSGTGNGTLNCVLNAKG